MRNQTLFVTTSLLLFVVLSGCGGGNDSSNSITPAPSSSSQGTSRGAVSTVPKTVEGLTFTLSSPLSAYKRGEEIPLTLTVTNNTSETINTYFNSSTIASLSSYNSSGMRTSYYGGGGGITLDTRITYAPGQTRQYSVPVPKQDNTYSEDAPSGEYRFVGWLSGSTILGNPFSYGGADSDLSSELLIINVIE